MAEGNGEGLVRFDDFDGELEEEWREAKGGKVFDKNRDEVGTVEDLYVWAGAEAVHLIKAEVDGRHVLIPTDAVTTATEDGVEVEQVKEVILGSPECRSRASEQFAWATTGWRCRRSCRTR